MTLDEFSESTYRKILNFEAYYRYQNKINPVQYPLDIPDDNAGLWTEFFNDFEE